MQNIQEQLEEVTREIKELNTKLGDNAELAEEIKEAKSNVKVAKKSLAEATTTGKEPKAVCDMLMLFYNDAVALLKTLQDEKARLQDEKARLQVRLFSLQDRLSPISSLKRSHTNKSNSSSANSTASTVLRKHSFRVKLLIRDKSCVLTGSTSFEAAHILPITFMRAPGGMEVFQRDYLEHCLDRSEGINDIRNGLLLRNDLHRMFDNFLFTIILGEDGRYMAKKSIFYDKNEKSIDFAKEIDFGLIAEQRPGAEFLSHHNKKFEVKNVIKAAAEPKPFPRQDTHTTFNIHTGMDSSEDFDDLKLKWIQNQRKINYQPCYDFLNAVE